MKPDFLPEQVQLARARCIDLGLHKPDDEVAVATVNGHGVPGIQYVPAWWLHVREERRFEGLTWTPGWTWGWTRTEEHLTGETVEIYWPGPTGTAWRTFGRLPDMIEVLGSKRKPAAETEERAA